MLHRHLNNGYTGMSELYMRVVFDRYVLKLQTEAEK